MAHWPDLHQPPASFPTAEITTIINRVRGTEVDTVKAAYAASVVVGFGLSQLPHDQPQPMGEGSPVSEEDGLKMLESAVKDAENPKMKAGGFSALPWASIIAFVLPYLLEWWKKRQSGV